MNVKELRKAKRELEGHISAQVAILVEQFKVRTGLSPSRIYVTMVDHTQMGDDEPVLSVGGTTIEVEI